MGDTDRPVRVAVVGSGLAGLSTTYLLSKVKATRADGSPLSIEVHLLEKNEDLGMDTASLSVKTEEGSYRVDVPMRSINGGSHGRVRQLYRHLGVPLVESGFSYSFSRLAQQLATPPSPPSPRSVDLSDDDSSVPPTPPPEYTQSFQSRAPTPPRHRQPARVDKPATSPRRPAQTTSILYEGASGLRFPPVSLPSQFRKSSHRVQLSYLADTLLLAVAYIYILLLASFYVRLGLARPASTIPPSRTMRDHLKQLCFRLLKLENIASVPLGEWCEKHRVPRRMREEVLVPLMAAVATIGVDEATEMPTGEVLDYIVDTFANSHYVTSPSFGVRGIVKRLVAPLPPSHIHLGVDIVSLAATESHEEGAYSIVFCQNGPEKTLLVDHIVFATQADQAARLLAMLPVHDKSTQAVVSALERFTYVRTLVVTHTDASVLPLAHSDRRDLNLAVFAPSSSSSFPPPFEPSSEDDLFLPSTSVQTTHIISHPSSTSSRPVFQTTNPIVPISTPHVLSSTWFSRAFVTKRSQTVLGRFLLDGRLKPQSERTLQGLPLGAQDAKRKGGVWFTGSYLAPGIPLLEGCVTSAEGVVRELLRQEGGSVSSALF
ncbi:microfibrillar-associated protein 1 [Rhodotorula toruloides]|uniref:Microfibrillar-associated protein 1 n=1 Tax=Rhodotorula toruloides TaxID=5286 RepID=A0A511KB90_RHOTO|nr:microfibrillar-associated protein 1 [Rhodotorula toruloides]